MSDLKDFLTGDLPTEMEKEAYYDKLHKVNEVLINSLPYLRKQFNDIKDGESVDLDTREIQIALPKEYWNNFDKIIEVYKLKDELNINDSNDDLDQIQNNITKIYNEKVSTLTTGETMISQFLLETIMGLVVHVAKTELMTKIQTAVDSGNPETLTRLLKSIVNTEALDASDDKDDDSEI